MSGGAGTGDGRVRVRSGSPYETPIGFSRAVRVGDRVVVSGTAPVLPDGGCPEGAEAQADRCWEIVVAALAEVGARPEHVVRTRTYLVDAADWEATGRAHGRVFADVRPASTMVVVAGLLDPRWRVEVEAEAVLDDVAGAVPPSEVEAEAVPDEVAGGVPPGEVEAGAVLD